MKTFTAKTLLLFCATLLVFACAKDDDPTPTPVPTPEPEKHSVAQVLEGNYWQEKICFTYMEAGSDIGSIKVSDDIIEEYAWTGGSYFDKRLNKFYVDPETEKLHAYNYEISYIGNWYYRNKYYIEYPDQSHIRIHATDELNSFVGAAFDVDLKVTSCTSGEIVLDGPIKPYISNNWQLDRLAEELDVIYLGIRVYWTKIENGAELFEPSSPLD